MHRALLVDPAIVASRARLDTRAGNRALLSNVRKGITWIAAGEGAIWVAVQR